MNLCGKGLTILGTFVPGVNRVWDQATVASPLVQKIPSFLELANKKLLTMVSPRLSQENSTVFIGAMTNAVCIMDGSGQPREPL